MDSTQEVLITATIHCSDSKVHQTVQYSTVQYSTVQYSTVQYSILTVLYTNMEEVRGGPVISYYPITIKYHLSLY